MAERKRCPTGEIWVTERGGCVAKKELTVQELARAYSEYFVGKKRPTGEEYVVLSEDRPEELEEIVRQAHGEMLPEVWRYKFILESFNHIAELEDPDSPELEADIYTSDLMDWLGSTTDRYAYVDEAIEEFGKGKSIINDIMMGQLREKEEVYWEVLSKLRKELGEG